MDDKVDHIQSAIIEAHEKAKETITKSNKIKILPQYITDQIKENRKLRSMFIKERDPNI